MSQLALSIQGLTVYLEGKTGFRRVLSNIELDVTLGRTFALLGESGSGKTCLVQSILGLHSGQPGVVAGRAQVLGREVFTDIDRYVEFIDDANAPVVNKDIVGWRKLLNQRWKGVLGTEVAMIPQDASTALSPFHTVGKLFEATLKNSRPGMTHEAMRDEAIRWLCSMEMYDVESVLMRYMHELSGGMAQRVAIALALASQPRFIIADEPTTGLDATLRIQLIALLASVVKNHGVTLLLVTHDNAAARMLAYDVAILYAGTVVESGPVERVLEIEVANKHPYTRYLVESEQRLNKGERVQRARREEEPDKGCPYAANCERAFAPCAAAVPLLVEVVPGHKIACWAEGS